MQTGGGTLVFIKVKKEYEVYEIAHHVRNSCCNLWAANKYSGSSWTYRKFGNLHRIANLCVLRSHLTSHMESVHVEWVVVGHSLHIQLFGLLRQIFFFHVTEARFTVCLHHFQICLEIPSFWHLWNTSSFCTRYLNVYGNLYLYSFLQYNVSLGRLCCTDKPIWLWLLVGWLDAFKVAVRFLLSKFDY